MKKREEKLKFGFTTIQHDPRLRFELSKNDYYVADAIYHLSHNPNGAVFVWCYASRETLCKFFGISRLTVINIVKKLQKKVCLEDLMIDQNTKQVEISKMKDFDENSLVALGVNTEGIHRTIHYVVKGETVSRIYFEDRSNADVDNSVIFQILQAHGKAVENDKR